LSGKKKKIYIWCHRRENRERNLEEKFSKDVLEGFWSFANVYYCSCTYCRGAVHL